MYKQVKKRLFGGVSVHPAGVNSSKTNFLQTLSGRDIVRGAEHAEIALIAKLLVRRSCDSHNAPYGCHTGAVTVSWARYA